MTNNKKLKEICVGSVGLASFNGLNANNLNAVGMGLVMGSYIPEVGSHGSRDGQVTVFAVHVVSTRPEIFKERLLIL